MIYLNKHFNYRKYLLSLIIAGSFLFANASNTWLHIFLTPNDRVRIISNELNDIDSIYYTTPDSEETSLSNLNIQSRFNGLQVLSSTEIDKIILGTNIPTLYIDTEVYVDEIRDKVNYMEANLKYIQYNEDQDIVESKVNIRGRGNSTWTFPKKPYRLKFDKKQSLGGLRKAKSFVLLANFLDNTVLKDAVAFKMAELTGMPHTNHFVPVNLVLNGRHRGCYVMTEKVGINSGSVDIDETQGILWELDAHYDEEFKFFPSAYSIPAMVKDPDFHEITENDAEKTDSIWRFWKEDLDSALKNASKGEWTESFDEEQFINFILVNLVMGNNEISHPKSVYMFKENREAKYKFGPVWDFDYSAGFEASYSAPLLSRRLYPAMYSFLYNIVRNPEFLEKFRQRYESFKEEILPLIYEFIDIQSAKIRIAAYNDADIWTYKTWFGQPENQELDKSNFDENVKALKQWLANRIEAIDASETLLLY